MCNYRQLYNVIQMDKNYYALYILIQKDLLFVFVCLFVLKSKMHSTMEIERKRMLFLHLC
uniref:Uncharacterized protein n=1 Tax=Macaca fascicularis TaxID=9541 RepID=Q9GMN6_MACFA|nr:hypothetical protein [Macaca fascicularis]